jgi:hypothetical protein
MQSRNSLRMSGQSSCNGENPDKPMVESQPSARRRSSSWSTEPQRRSEICGSQTILDRIGLKTHFTKVQLLLTHISDIVHHTSWPKWLGDKDESLSLLRDFTDSNVNADLSVSGTTKIGGDESWFCPYCEKVASDPDTPRHTVEKINNGNHKFFVKEGTTIATWIQDPKLKTTNESYETKYNCWFTHNWAKRKKSRQTRTHCRLCQTPKPTELLYEASHILESREDKPHLAKTYAIVKCAETLADDESADMPGPAKKQSRPGTPPAPLTLSAGLGIFSPAGTKTGTKALQRKSLVDLAD